MINGKPGTGKEVFARAIRSASPLARGQLVMVDCSAVSPGLIGSGLFGHERGAFTGAFDRQVGRLVQADGGSVIIDHVECIPLETQAKLVEFLNSGEVQMIGGSIRQSVYVRIIAPSISLIDKLIEAGLFLQDLYYALSSQQLTLPSLSERRGALRQEEHTS